MSGPRVPPQTGDEPWDGWYDTETEDLPLGDAPPSPPDDDDGDL